MHEKNTSLQNCVTFVLLQPCVMSNHSAVGLLQCRSLLLNLTNFSLSADAYEWKSELALIKMQNIFAQNITF